jgi:hypothetical protein
MLENKAICQDPKSNERLNQHSPESKEARYQNLAANYKKANRKLKWALDKLLDTDSHADFHLDDANVMGLLRKCFSYVIIKKSVVKVKLIKALLSTEIEAEKADESDISEFSDTNVQHIENNTKATSKIFS